MSDEIIIDGIDDTELEKAKKTSVFELTKEEYYDIVNKVIAGDPDGYDRLIKRAEKNLFNLIKLTCIRAGYPSAASEAMQLTDIKIFKYFVTHYVFAGDSDEINPDYRGLSAWMKAVAENATKDVISRNNKYYTMLDWSYCGTDESDEEDSPKKEISSPAPGPEEAVIKSISNIDRLKECVNVVLSSRNSVYKVLVWLGHRVLVYKHGLTNIGANKAIVERFREKTFFEIYDFILKESRDIEWLTLTSAQKEKIVNGLAKESDGKAIGNCTLSEMFMVKGEEETISDWKNRLDYLLRNNDGLREDTDGDTDEEETK